MKTSTLLFIAGGLLLAYVVYKFLMQSSTSSMNSNVPPAGYAVYGYALKTSTGWTKLDATTQGNLENYLDSGKNQTAAALTSNYANLNALGTWFPPLPSVATQTALNNSGSSSSSSGGGIAADLGTILGIAKNFA